MNSNWFSEQSFQNCITFKVFLLIPERFQKNVCSRVLFSESYWLMANNCTQNAFYFWDWFSFSKKAASCWPKYNKNKFITEILSEFPSKNTFQRSLLQFHLKKPFNCVPSQYRNKQRVILELSHCHVCPS